MGTPGRPTDPKRSFSKVASALSQPGGGRPRAILTNGAAPLESHLNRDRNVALAEALLAGIRSGTDPAELATAFSRRVSFEIQGDEDTLPWVGRRTGRAAAAGFFRNLRELTETVRCDVDEVLCSESRAVIVGNIALRLKETGRIFKSQFAIILTVAEDEIVRCQMLGDSFGLSHVVRPL